MVLSFGFANEEELGWDLSMRYDSKKGTHIITFDRKDYVIKKVLADFRADCSIGRATRVVLAQHDKDEPVVFKDVWADVSRERENQIHTRIISDLEIHFGSDHEQLKKYKEMFFNVLGAEEVKLSDDSLDDTRHMITGKGIGELDLSSSQPFDIVSQKDLTTKPGESSIGHLSHHQSQPDTLASATQTAHQKNPPSNSWTRVFHRVHYRIQMEEHATPLGSILDLGVCFSAIKSAIECELPGVYLGQPLLTGMKLKWSTFSL